MPQLLAVEWDGAEARVVAASARGARVVIEQAFSVTLRSRVPGSDQSDVDPGARLAAALAARGIGRAEALVAVGRANIELRQLSLPPAPDDELPEMVRFQAMREFNELDEHWLLDFVPIDQPGQPGEPGGPPHREVLAAAMAPALATQIEETCTQAGLRPRRLVLRACEAASLLGRQRRIDPGRLTMLVDLLPDEIDLTVVADRRVVYLRTTRLAEDPLEQPEQAPALLAEIRRTMVAAQNQLGGRRVEAIAVCGSDPAHAALCRSIEQNLGVSAETFGPFDGLELGPELARALPDHPGRFAPLLGAVLAELEQSGHAIDFLHPRRPAPPPSQRVRYIAAAAVALLAIGGYLGYRQLAKMWLTDEIATLQVEAPRWEARAKKAEEEAKEAEIIGKWASADVVWLDELARLSEKLPEAREAKLNKLTLDTVPGGGKIGLDGLARTAESVSELEAALRDPSHRVVPNKTSDDRSSRYYAWLFSSSMGIQKEKP